ncbi:MAG: glycosyltransferase 87 family protein [Acidobacteriota bacterium]
MTIRGVVSGFLILGGLAGFVLVSHGYGSPHLHLPLYVLTAVIHLVAVLVCRQARDSRPALVFVVLLALLLRLVVCLTPESREADYYRYMWDGALTAHGISPYRFSPARILRGEVKSAEVVKLSEEGRDVLARINHPELRTLYPPVAQVLFALGYLIGPFNSLAWRAVLLLLDVVAGLLILVMLRSARLPLAWSIGYLWNPLLVTETYHYRHLDLALAPFLLLFLWGAWKHRPYVTAGGLAAATAVKIWPILLLPVLATRFWSRRVLLTKAALAFTLLAVLLFVPYWTSVGAAASSGTVAYAKTWNANELAFRGIQAVGYELDRMAGGLVDSRIASRAILVLLLLGAALWLGFKSRESGIEGLALATSTLILLMVVAGPTVYPWYFIPALALSPFLRRPALLFWGPLLILTALSRSTPDPHALLVMIHLPAWLIVIFQLKEVHRQGVKRHA